MHLSHDSVCGVKPAEKRRTERYPIALAGYAGVIRTPLNSITGHTADVSRSGFALVLDPADAILFAPGDRIEFEIDFSGTVTDESEVVLAGTGRVVRVTNYCRNSAGAVLAVKTRNAHLMRRTHIDPS